MLIAPVHPLDGITGQEAYLALKQPVAISDFSFGLDDVQLTIETEILNL
jgi:hypothetical protein